MKFIIYKIVNNFNSHEYIGVHGTYNINDNYMGSGTALREAILEYGIGNFTKTILHIFDNKQEALNKERELVNNEYILREDTYNKVVGGGDLNTTGYCTVLIDGQYKLIPSSQYDKNIHKRAMSDKINVYTEHGHELISIEDYDPDKHMINTSGKVSVKNGKGYKLVTAEEFAKGGYEATNKGMVVVKNPVDKSRTILVTSEEFKTGKYEGVTAGLTTARTKDGKFIKVSKYDERFKTGELEHVSTGRKFINNGIARKLVYPEQLEKYLNTGWKLGKKL